MRARLGLGDTGYVAFLGAKEPRKNVPNLIRGWVAGGARPADPPALVIAGGQGHDDEIDRAVAEVPAHLRLLRPGYLRYADLPGFLGGALVAAYPSYGEGFGLPILEAMACGDAGADHARGCRCPRSAATRSPTPARTRTQIARDLAALLDDEPRRLTLAKAGLRPGQGVHLGVAAPRCTSPPGRGPSASLIGRLRAIWVRSAHRRSGMMGGCSTPSFPPVAAARGCGRCRGPATRSSCTR